MKTYTVYVSVGLVGCKRECEIEVEDDATEQDIEDAATEALWTMIEWGWHEPKETKPFRQRNTVPSETR